MDRIYRESGLLFVYVCWRLCDAACKIHNTAFFRLDRCNTLSAAASKHVCVRYVLRSVCLAQTMRTMCARGLKQGVVPTCVLHRADWLLYFSFSGMLSARGRTWLDTPEP
jgi:hypothetical protein